MAKEKQIDALADAEPGVGVVKDKKLDALADKFAELRDEKADLATKMTKVEQDIIERMVEIKCRIYRYDDREVKIKDGKPHVKVKSIKVGESE